MGQVVPKGQDMKAGLQRDSIKVLEALGRQVEEWQRTLEDEPSDIEFAIRLAPVSGPGTNSASARASFEQIFLGLQKFNDTGGKEVDLYRIGVLDVTCNQTDRAMAEHSFLLTALPSKSYRGMVMIPSYQSYAFVRIATSGYPGTGPALYEAMNKFIDSARPAVVRSEVNVATDPLQLLFGTYGPTFAIRWPDRIFPPRREWDQNEGEDGSPLLDPNPE